ARSASIRTPLPSRSTDFYSERYFGGSVLRCAVALALIVVVSFAAPFDSAAQSSKKKKKKTAKHAAPCRSGCKPDTTVPDIATSTADDAAALQQLSELARSLHNATPGSYDKLSAFAAKHASDVWGARAALALGYDDYQKNRVAPAIAWFAKAKGDSVLQEYVLYWRAQANRVSKRNSDAYADLQKILAEYPNSAIKEQVLESFAPTAVEMGRAQMALDALNGYSATNSKPALLLERA